MGSDAVELLLAVYDSFNRVLAGAEDLRPLLAEIYTPDVVMEPGEPDTWFGGYTVRGIDELLHWWRTWLAEVEAVRLEAEGVVDVGPALVAHVRITGRFRRSGIAFDEPYAHVVTFAGERIERLRVYRDPAAAMRFATLAEPPRLASEVESTTGKRRS